MAEFTQTPSGAHEPPRGNEALRPLLHASNINETTFLATDYLNHFNEIEMLIDLIPDMKSILADARKWRSKRYTAHFRDSGFSTRDLAIEAYHRAPAPVLTRFEESVDRLNLLVAVCLDRIERAILQEVTTRASRDLKRMIDVVSAIISGEDTRIGQDEIDAVFDDGR